MMMELLNSNKEIDHLPELTLALSPRVPIDKSVNSSGLLTLVESRKRKFDDHLLKNIAERALVETSDHANVDLQVKDPLPLDWEQCLDLQSGKMYYQNRRTLRKTSKCPKDDHHHHAHKLDLELNISTFSNQSNVSTKAIIKDTMYLSTSSGSNMDMVALPCMNCHLLVIVSKSSPTCPNCKYIDHSLYSKQQQNVSPPRHKNNNVKSLLTLSLLK